MGDRNLTAFVSIIEHGNGGPAHNVAVRNNRFTVGKDTKGELNRLFALGPSLGRDKENMHVDCNEITVNSDDGGAVPNNPSVFYFASGRDQGLYSQFIDSSITDNVINGSGRIEHFWDFKTNNFPSTGWPKKNLDISNSNFSIEWSDAEFE